METSCSQANNLFAFHLQAVLTVTNLLKVSCKEARYCSIGEMTCPDLTESRLGHMILAIELAHGGKSSTLEGDQRNFDSVEQLSANLTATGYFIDPILAKIAFLAVCLRKPLLLEGPAGSGKT
jgi:hypothetical protein